MSEIFLSESHPETCATDCREIDHEALKLLMIEKIRLAFADVGIVERAVHLQIFCLHPFAIFPIFTLLGDLADIDFRIEVCCERFSVVSGVAVNNVEIAHL